MMLEVNGRWPSSLALIFLGSNDVDKWHKDKLIGSQLAIDLNSVM
jgi:hypothetical protein